MTASWGPLPSACLLALVLCGSACEQRVAPAQDAQPLTPSPQGLAQLPVPSSVPSVNGREHALHLEAGHYLTVRIRQTLFTESARPGDPFEATLLSELSSAGRTFARRGAVLTGEIASSDPARPDALSLRLTALAGADGARLALSTEELRPLPRNAGAGAILPAELVLGFRLAAPLTLTILESR